MQVGASEQAATDGHRHACFTRQPDAVVSNPRTPGSGGSSGSAKGNGNLGAANGTASSANKRLQQQQQQQHRSVSVCKDSAGADDAALMPQSRSASQGTAETVATAPPPASTAATMPPPDSPLNPFVAVRSKTWSDMLLDGDAAGCRESLALPAAQPQLPTIILFCAFASIRGAACYNRLTQQSLSKIQFLQTAAKPVQQNNQMPTK